MEKKKRDDRKNAIILILKTIQTLERTKQVNFINDRTKRLIEAAAEHLKDAILYEVQ